jgi:hypothetical protein
MAAPESPSEVDASRGGFAHTQDGGVAGIGLLRRELSRLRWVSLPALLLPALGDICLL